MTMTPAQRAVLELAKKNGSSPMEQSAEFMLHDLTQACIDVLRTQKKPFADLGEQQQDSVIRELSDRLRKTVYIAADILQGGEVIRVPMLLQDFKAGKDLKITGLIEADDPGRYDLMDKAHSKSKVTILLQEMDYFAGMGNIQADKDQKSLGLDSSTEGGAVQEKAGKAKSTPRVTDSKPKSEKAISIPVKTLEQARDFVVVQQNGTLAGLQNFLKCDITKARAIHQLLEGEGLLTAPTNDREDRNIVREKPADAGIPASNDVEKAEDQVGKATGFDGFEDLATEPKDVEVEDEKPEDDEGLSDRLVATIRALVVERQSASISTITTTLNISESLAGEVLDRLEMEGIVSEEDDLGGRNVLEAKAS